MAICGIDLAGRVAATLRGNAMVLRRTIETVEPVNPAGSPTTSSTDYPCQGYEQSLQSVRLLKSQIRAGTVVFGIYGATLDVPPREGDLVITDDGDHKVYHIPDRDSDFTVWVLMTTRISP